MAPTPTGLTKEPTYYYKELETIDDADGVWQFADRWPEVEAICSFRPTDEVIDLGCAEGLITMEVARQVSCIRGVEMREPRVEAAKQIASERGLANVTFEVGSVVDLPLPIQGYDVVIFLGVLHHLPAEAAGPVLTKVFNAAKREVLIRTPLFDQRAAIRTTQIALAASLFQFDLTIFPQTEAGKGSLMVARKHAAV